MLDLQVRVVRDKLCSRNSSGCMMRGATCLVSRREEGEGEEEQQTLVAAALVLSNLVSCPAKYNCDIFTILCLSVSLSVRLSLSLSLSRALSGTAYQSTRSESFHIFRKYRSYILDSSKYF